MSHQPLPALDKRAAVLLALSVLCGITYFIALPWKDAIPLQWLLKGGGIILLAVMAYRVERPLHKGLALGLAFGAGGDILLEVSTFVAGLGSFLTSHLVYTILFIMVMHREGMESMARKILAAAILVTGIAMAAWLLPDLGDFTVPVLVYIAVIGAMTMAAALTPFASNRVLAGAIIFMISDSLIAIGKFKTGFPGIGHAIWGTYYAAQYCIATGFLAGWKNRKTD